jgi:hypothetical protein
MAQKILTTRNVTGVTYKIDEILTAYQQAEVLTDILQRLAVEEFTFGSYAEINSALQDGTIVEGQFVIYINKLQLDPIPVVVVAKYRNV